jgi:uncharacterized protein (DUF488 family)
VTLLTVGHGTASQDALTALLTGAGVELVVDVRIAPGSRRHPHVLRAELERWLPAAGIGYRWERDLGGFRRPPPDSPDVAWQEPMFRGYAAWMRQEPFRAALRRVLADAAARRTTVLCSEAVWWRCHRRLVADAAVLLHEVPVRHLMHDGRLVAHSRRKGYGSGRTACWCTTRARCRGEGLSRGWAGGRGCAGVRHRAPPGEARGSAADDADPPRAIGASRGVSGRRP